VAGKQLSVAAVVAVCLRNSRLSMFASVGQRMVSRTGSDQPALLLQ
jgi:hypothetical protein